MDTKPANVFADLRVLLATEYHRRMTLGKCDHCGRLPATVQELEAVRKFLADNGANDEPLLSPATGDIMKGLPTFAEDPDANIDRPAEVA